MKNFQPPAKESGQHWVPALFVLLSFLNLSPGAENPSVDARTAAALVGDLGQRQALRIEGNKMFTKEQILDGLVWHIDYHIAAHPAAPLQSYIRQLEQKIGLGYQHAGFPEASV